MYRLKFWILALTLIVAGINVLCLSKIQISNQPDQVLKSSNLLQKTIEWQTNGLYKPQSIYVDFVWGIDKYIAQNPDTTKWKPPNKGSVVLDPKFYPGLKMN